MLLYGNFTVRIAPCLEVGSVVAVDKRLTNSGDNLYRHQRHGQGQLLLTKGLPSKVFGLAWVVRLIVNRGRIFQALPPCGEIVTLD